MFKVYVTYYMFTFYPHYKKVFRVNPFILSCFPMKTFLWYPLIIGIIIDVIKSKTSNPY